MITFNLEMDSKSNKKGENLLMIRCSYKRTHKRLNLAIRINPKFWDKKKKQIKSSHPSYKNITTIVTNRLNELEIRYVELLAAGQIFTLDQIFVADPKKANDNFFEFARDTKLAEIKANKKLGTLRRYEAVLAKFEEFTGSKLRLHQIDYMLVKKFQTYLSFTKGNGQDTISSNLSVIRTIVNEAMKYGLYTNKNPFAGITLKYTDNTKQKLTLEELKVFKNVALPNIRSLHLARDLFMACFYAGGCRAGDMIAMTKSAVKDGKLFYFQRKTGKKVEIPILPELEKILKLYDQHPDYIFPFFNQGDTINEITINSKISYINKYLKEVCKYAGIFKHITTHCARHTFADLSLMMNNNDIYGLKEILGHASIKITEKYLRERNYSKTESIMKSIDENIK